MLNFVICEDNKKNREKLINIITKIMMPYDFDYIVHEFEDYDNKMNKLINETYEKKIYILDIELPSRSGLDIARKIRTRDWESIIIVCTAYYDLALEAIKNRLMLLDFISKFNNFEERVKTSIELAIKILENKKELILENGNILYKIKYDDIVYIVKDTLERKSIINTVNGEYKVSQNISSIMRSLDARFFQTHRSCIVNKEYIKEIDFKEGKITFDNNEFVYLLARGKKKGLKEYVGISK
jgi:two-component system response regulator AgrA